MKFEDANADGSKTGDSGPSVSFNIRIYKDNGTTPGSLDAGDTPVDTVGTATGTGLWTKAGLKPGPYIVCEESKAGWNQSAPSGSVCQLAASGLENGGYAVNVTSGNDSGNKDFGNYRNGSISAMKFEDQNPDGLKTGDSGP